jgi:hypothetical protein
MVKMIIKTPQFIMKKLLFTFLLLNSIFAFSQNQNSEQAAAFLHCDHKNGKEI